MPDDNNKVKPGGKTGETLLSVLGALGSIAGPLLTGQNIDLGLPFKMGAQYFQDSRMKNDLMKALNSNPHTQGIVEDVQGTIDQGGLPGLLQGMGQDQLSDNFSPQQPQLSNGLQIDNSAINPIIPGVSEPLREQAASEQVQPSAKAMSDAEYLKSPEFLKVLSEFRPDIAEKVIASQMSQRPVDPTTQILKTLALKDYQSPEEKQEIKSQEKIEQSDIVEQRQQRATAEKARLDREKFSSAENAALKAANEAQTNMDIMLDSVQSGVYPTTFEKLISDNSMAAGTYTALNPKSKESIQLARDINKMVMSVVKQQSGVQYGYRELQWIKATQPSKWDSPEMFKNGVSMAKNISKLNSMGLILNKATRSKNMDVAIRNGISIEQAKAWEILTKKLAQTDSASKEQSVFTDPKNKRLLEVLGMRMLDAPKGGK